MEANTNISLVKQIYGYFGEGNIKGVIDMLTDDITWIIPEIKKLSAFRYAQRKR